MSNPTKTPAQNSQSSGSSSSSSGPAVAPHWRQLLDAETINRCISRLSYEIVERDRDISKLAIVGVRTCGEFIAMRIRKRIEEIEGRSIPFGILDITLYRDDITSNSVNPQLRSTDLPFAVSGARIILVDDVLYTGRTVRAALDAIMDFGRPACVELACLIDRGHRELPIRADYVGKNVPSNKNENIRVRLKEQGLEDGVYLIPKE